MEPALDRAASRLTAALGLLLAGCALPGEGCAGLGGTPHVAVEMMFGLSRPDGAPVPTADWDRFLAEVVTPRAPGGLTVFEARGQWRDPAGQAVREPSRVVRIVLPRPSFDPALIRAVAEAYRGRFQQDAVGVVTTRACAAF